MITSPSSVPVLGEYLDRHSVKTRSTRDIFLGPAFPDQVPWEFSATWSVSSILHLITVTDGDGVIQHTVLGDSTVTEIRGAADSNGRPHLFWKEKDGSAKVRFFDPSVQAYTVMALPEDTVSGAISLDDRRPTSTSWNDVILCTLESTQMVFRYQRERYLVPHTFHTFDSSKAIGTVTGFGMTNQYRMEARVLR